ncbi:hypothetical protein [Bacteroides caccae]|jgi:hypothetical protein|uniref:hypothetical protein n=1 Tax=Bacteroides caccae TaxID=47678 RepID=UPI0015BF916A|nr:hypothetical protein [Bacteroides caccae]
MRNLFFEERLDKSFFAERVYLLLKGIAGVPYDTLSLPVDAYGIAAVYMQAGDKLDINRN